MATSPRILISINGMGNPAAGNTEAWATALFPDGILEESAGRRWMRVGDERTFLLEVSYEDFNDALAGKFGEVWDVVLGALPGQVEEVLKDFVGDVVSNVLLKDALNGAQRRFVDAYGEAIRIAIEEKPAGTDTRNARLGVLCHSLGTLIGYEGLHAAADSPLVTHLRANVVLCAPMLSPIGAAQSFVAQDRYLTRCGCNKPAKRRTMGRCLALYDLSDPFYRIQESRFYEAGLRGDLVDDYQEFDSAPGAARWKGHSMLDSYLAHNGDRVARFLFS